jgi:hypothetical protein
MSSVSDAPKCGVTYDRNWRQLLRLKYSLSTFIVQVSLTTITYDHQKIYSFNFMGPTTMKVQTTHQPLKLDKNEHTWMNSTSKNVNDNRGRHWEGIPIGDSAKFNFSTKYCVLINKNIFSNTIEILKQLIFFMFETFLLKNVLLTFSELPLWACCSIPFLIFLSMLDSMENHQM